MRLSLSSKKKTTTISDTQPAPSAQGIIVGGGAKGNLFARLVRPVKSVLHRKLVWIPALVVLLMCLSGTVYYATKEKPVTVTPPTEQVNLSALNDQADKKVISTRQEETSQPLATTATTEEKKAYYTSKIWLMVKDGKQADIAKYYVVEIKPQAIDFDVDVNETLVRALMMSEYKEEARPILTKIINFYKVSSTNANETTKKYLEDKLAYYEEMEASW